MPRTQEVSHGCRAQPTGELGEVVGRVQPLDRGVPVVAPDQVVPLRDDVAQRAALVAERDAAVHAAAGLGLDDRQQRPPRTAGVDLVPVVGALLDRTSLGDLAAVLETAGSAMVEPSPSRGLGTQSVLRKPAAQPWRASIIFVAVSCSSSPSASAFALASITIRKSRGITSVNRVRAVSQSSSSSAATCEPVSSACARTISSSSTAASSVTGPSSTSSLLTRTSLRSSTQATPPDMPAAKLRPVLPSTATRPPVMYSQPWSPTPSVTSRAPELRTANRSPTPPQMKMSPEVAP